MNLVSRRGFTLVEALVALSVLSFGVLGSLGLIIHAVGDLRAARLHHHAIDLTADLAARLRSAGPAGGDAAAEFFGDELGEWQARAAAELPLGEGSLETLIDGRVNEFRITVSWADVGRDRSEHSLRLVMGAAL